MKHLSKSPFRWLLGDSFKLRPVSMTVIASSDHETTLVAEDQDPQLHFELAGARPIRGGVYDLILRSKAPNPGLLSPILYYDAGRGFSEECAIPLVFHRFSPSKLTARFVLPAPAHQLRLDPRESTGKIFISCQATLIQSNKIRSLINLGHFARYLVQSGRTKAMLRHAWSLYRLGGIRKIYDQANAKARIAPPPPPLSQNYSSKAKFVVPSRSDLSGTPRVAIHLHLYYTDLVDEFARYLSNIPFGFDLYVSIPATAEKEPLAHALSKIPHVGRVIIRPVENRGRDIAPFIVEFSKDLLRYDLCAHIQSKKSVYNQGATAGWREYILESLFGSPQRVRGICELLSSKEYGLIYPQTFNKVPYAANTWLANKGLALQWMSRLGLHAIPDGYFHFPAGSMFWARVDAISPLLNAGIVLSDFPEEGRQTDGTLAHLIERMLGVVPQSRGHALGVVPDTSTPSWSKWRFDQYLARPKSYIEANIQDPDVKVVIFDIFDTLVSRPLLNAGHIKKLLSDYASRLGVHQFAAIRNELEEQCRIAAGKDVDLDRIYKFIDDKSGIDSSILRRIFQKEIELELSSVSGLPERIELIRTAKASGKKVFLASDMFLPRSALETLLASVGVVGWDQLYLSSERGVRKDRGDMYPLILGEQRVTASECLMIGDNERSDLQIPADMGFRTSHILKASHLAASLPRLEDIFESKLEPTDGDEITWGLLCNKFFSALQHPQFNPSNLFGPDPEAIGYGVLGPILASFTHWLLEEARKRNIAELLFLAREGKLLKDAYDIWTGGIADAPRSPYLVVSRRAVSVPSIQTAADIHRILTSTHYILGPLDQLLQIRLGLELTDAMWRSLEENGIWRRGQLVHVLNEGGSNLMPLSKAILPWVLEISERERIPLQRYFESLQVDTDRNAAVVDVGYAGTIQDYLNQLLQKPVGGFYFATEQRAKSMATRNGTFAVGCFADGVERSASSAKIYTQSFYLEKMLSADEAQIVCYSQGPELIGHFQELSDSELDARPVRHAMQRAALAFVADAKRAQQTLAPNFLVAPATAELLFERLIEGMSNDERSVFASLALDDTYTGRGVVT